MAERMIDPIETWRLDSIVTSLMLICWLIVGDNFGWDVNKTEVPCLEIVTLFAR
jgi:hypothetical protein